MGIALIFTSEDDADLADLQEKFKYHSDMLELIKTIDEPDNRQIGYLAYHSTLSISDQEPGWLKDCALIQLDAGQVL